MPWAIITDDLLNLPHLALNLWVIGMQQKRILTFERDFFDLHIKIK